MADTFLNRLGNVFRLSSNAGTPPCGDLDTISADSFTEGPPHSNADLKQSVTSSKFMAILSCDLIDLTLLRDKLWSGCHRCECNIRAVVWKVMFGYLPIRIDRHEDVSRRKRAEYQTLLNLYHEDIERFNSGESSGKDGRLYRQIYIDIPRTCFNSVDLFRDSPIFTSLMQRVLYIWSLRNPACSYVQGMNDLVVPVLIVLIEGKYSRDVCSVSSIDMSEHDVLDLEADLYWLICKLLQNLQDHYTDCQPGIQDMTQKLTELIKRVDIDLFQHLESEGIDFTQISFRWFNCLFTREFKHDCVLRLWDTCIAEQDGFSVFIVYFAAAFLLKHASKIQANSFQNILILLNASETTRDRFDVKDIDTVIAEAFVLKSLFHDSPHHLVTL